MTTDIGAADNNLNGDGDNDTRYVGHDNRNVSAKELAALELDKLQRAFSSAAQVPVTLGNAQWFTKFRAHHSCVDHYRIWRIFVAGDAAHIHPRRQGMNTELQDAVNLAWKLAAVIQHDAPESLLETYESERLHVARETISFTDKLFSLAAWQSGWRVRVIVLGLCRRKCFASLLSLVFATVKILFLLQQTHLIPSQAGNTDF